MLLDLSNLNTIGFYLTLVCVFGFVGSMVLLLRSGHGYSNRDADSHAVDFPGGLKEGHGGVPAFIWVFFAAMFIWATVYFVIHASEFAIIFSPG
jgi:hypothetical protein